MAKIIINGVEKEYREGTSYEAIANEYQAEYGNMIALVLEDYKIRELIKTVQKDCRLSFLTLKDSIGHKTYVRTATMMLVKAVYDVLGADVVEKV